MISAATKVLISARELITNEDHWTQGTNARDRRNMGVSANNSTAVCFCAQGAVLRVSKELKVSGPDQCEARSQAEHLLTSAAKTLGFPGFVVLNDYSRNQSNVGEERNHAAVLMMFDLAIGSKTT